jgi:hypothetical protein
MVDLQCALISLRFANLVITAEYLHGDKILFHRGGVPHIYDLSSGVIIAENWELSGCGLESSFRSSLKNRYGGTEIDEKWKKMSDHDKALWYHKVMVGKMSEREISMPALSFIVSLASRQVKGDELIKGLKAQGLRMPVNFKATRLYTGGWKLEAMQEGVKQVFTAEAFAKYFS